MGVARNAQTSYLKPLTSYLIPLTAYLFLFLHFSVFAQTPDPGCNCIQIGSLCWATCNVAEPGTFAASPSDTGWYYQWGVNVGWRPSPNTPLLNSNGGDVWDNTNPPPGSSNPWTTTPCPAGWRLPTQAEFAYLATYVFGSGADRLSGMNGKFFDSGDPNQPLLFLPSAGSRNYSTGSLCIVNSPDAWGTLNTVGSHGYYWSSSNSMQCSSAYAYNLYFTIGYVNPDYSNDGTQGFTLRCVADL